MTREEAIDRFKEARVGHYEFLSMETLNMAIKALEQEPCKVSEYDKDHIWYKGCQYISLRRFLEVKAETEQEPTETWSIKDVADTFKKHGLIVEQEQKTGHWIIDIDESRRWDRKRFYCSECGDWQTYGETKFCHDCGHAMKVRKSERTSLEPKDVSADEYTKYGKWMGK